MATVSRALVSFFLIAAASLAYAATKPESIQATDVDGVTLSIPSERNLKATVVFFVLPDCPISNAYAPEVKRIATEYAKKNIETWIVYVDPDLSAAEMRKHASDYGLEGHLICDRSRDLVKKLGVTIAPEVAVVNSRGERLYRGRIDNLYADYGKRRVKPTEHDLRDALEAVLTGKPVANETTKAIGCIISK